MREKELLEVLAKALVDHPDQVSVTEVQGEKSAILELRVATEDVGKVIGKQGRIAESLRIIVKSAAVKEGRRVIVEIIT